MRTRRACGQATTEFLLVMLILIPMLAMAMQAIVYLYAQLIAANAAQEAARSAAVHVGDGAGFIHRSRQTAVENVVRVRCRELFPFTRSEEDVQVTVSPASGGDPRANEMVAVTVTIRVPSEPFRLVSKSNLYATATGRAFIEPWGGPEPGTLGAPASDYPVRNAGGGGGGGAW